MIVMKDSKKEEIANEICALWSPLDDEERAMISKELTVEQFRKNEIIYDETDRPSRMMFLIQGKVKIFKDGISGRNQIVRVIKPVGIFGYRPYFAGEDYRTTATAFEPSVVAFVPMEIIVELMKRNFGVASFIIRHLAIELGQSDDRTINLTQKHIRGRLAEALPQGQLRHGGRRLHAEHLPESRRPGQYVEHDHQQCHSHALHLCQRKAHCHRWKEDKTDKDRRT